MVELDGVFHCDSNDSGMRSDGQEIDWQGQKHYKHTKKQQPLKPLRKINMSNEQ